MKAKKILSALMAATMVATSMSVMSLSVSAANSAAVSLMPGSASDVSGGTAAMEGGAVKLTAGAENTTFTWNLDKKVDLNTLTNLYFSIEQQGGFDIKITSTSANADSTPSVSADFGNKEIFGKKDGAPDAPNGLGTLITTASIKDSQLVDDNNVNWQGAYTWPGCPNPLPADGVVTIKTVSVIVGANGNATLSNLYMSDDVGAPGSANAETKTYYNPYTATVDLDLLPVSDMSKWQTMEIGADSDNAYGDNLSNPGLKMEQSGSGIKVTISDKLSPEASRIWYPARTTMEQKDVALSGKYLYYSIKASGDWNLNLMLGDDPSDTANVLKLAPYISREKKPTMKVIYSGSGDKSKTFGYDDDGKAGTYIGRLDLEAVIKEVIKGGADGGKLPESILNDGKVNISATIVWAIGLAGTNTSVDKLFIGNGGEQDSNPVFGGGSTTTTNGGNNGGNTNNTTKKPSGNNPSTGDVTYAYAAVILMIAAAGTVVLVSKKAKN